MMLMNKDHWEEQFAHIFPIKKRISYRAVYEICEEPLSLLGHEPEEGWMKFTYQYVCHILYPDAEFKKKKCCFFPPVRSSIWQCFSSCLTASGRCFRTNRWRTLHFLGDEEASSFECSAEYSRFKKVFRTGIHL